jgi:hypothetical protein
MSLADRDVNRGDPVEVAPGVPTDRVRWGPIVAGVFAALTAMAVLSTLGSAIGLSAYDPGDDTRRFAIGAGIWSILSMLLSFAFGGWLAARSAAVKGSDNGLLNGFMVAGVGIPVLMFVLGATSALMAHAVVAGNRDRDMTASNALQSDGASARQASAVIRGSSDGTTSNRDQSNDDDARRAARRTAWGTLVSLALAIGAASFAGMIGASDDRYRRDHGRHHHDSDYPAGTGTGSTAGGA